MNLLNLLAALILAALVSLPLPVISGEGHDHGEAPAAATGPALPRFAAVSDSFELVGILDGKRITLYLDRAADNSPVPDAKIELDIGGTKVDAAKHGDDAYEVVLPGAPVPGVIAITATVTAGGEVDLLAGELDIHGPASGADDHARSWQEYAAWIAAALAALGLLAWGTRRMTSVRVGGAA
jgi:hypothetical protein